MQINKSSKVKNVLILVLFLFFQNLIAQNGVSYEISLENKKEKEALEFYKNKVREIVSSKIETSLHLKQKLIEKAFNSKKDSISFIATYWLQANGEPLSYLFGSTFGRETKEFNELNLIMANIKVEPSGFKKISKDPKGKQIFVHFNYRKELDSITKQVRFVNYNYKKDANDFKKYKLTQPIHKGCRVSKKANLYDKDVQKKLRQCLSEKIDNVVKKNFNTSGFSKLSFLSGKTVKILSQFKFNKEGNVADVKSISLLPGLEKEAKRVIQKIRKVKPATKDGVNVGVIYTKSITFRTR